MTINRLLIVMVTLLAVPAQAERINIAAIVNDDVITTNDVNERRDLLMALGNIPPTAETQQRLTPKIMQSLIDETLQMQEAKRLSITITQEELDKAIAQMEAARRQEPGALRAFIKEHGMSQRTLENQARAQLAWGKVIQRKLRRNVSISQDEIARAQQAQAAAPGIEEVLFAALSLPIKDPADEPRAAALAEKIANEIRGGKMLSQIAAEYAVKENIGVNPPVWVPEASLQPGMQQALRALKPGDISAPLRSMNSFQLIHLLDRRTSKPVPENTEVAIKEIRVPPPPKPTKETLEQMRQLTLSVRANPGDCASEALGSVPPSAAKARFIRVQLGQLAPAVRGLVSHLGVGEISDPVPTSEGMQMLLLCERIEPATTGLPDAKKVRAELFAEKIELEAQKHMRNLRRDAFIDVKGL